jgi:hypothetical protein
MDVQCFDLDAVNSYAKFFPSWNEWFKIC